MDALRVAVIGCGVIGPVHMECFSGLEGARLAAVCDLDEAKARAAAGRFGAPRWTTAAAELFADPGIDAVSICTDHASHAELAVAALDAGKHVLCEKPFAHSPEGLAAMLAAGARHPELVFGGVFQHRFDPLAITLRELAESGGLGTLLTASARLYCERPLQYYRDVPWRGHWATEGGSVLINQAIHFLDMLLWVAGDAESVMAEWANRVHREVMETEDTIHLAMRLAGGAIGGFEATNGAHLPWAWSMELCGQNGAVELADDKPIRVAFRDSEAQERWAERFAEAAEARAVTVGKSYYGSGHPAQLADFVQAVRGGHELRVTAASAARTARVAQAAYESGREGRRVSLMSDWQ